MCYFEKLVRLFGFGPKDVRVAETAPLEEPQVTQPKGPMTSDFEWQMLDQINMHLRVGKAIECILANPRPIERLDLKEWTIVEGSPHKVQHKSGMFRPFNFDDLPRRTSDFPVLVGQANGKRFVFDGAHRTAQGVLLKKASIPAIIFSEEETRSFIRPGFDAQFNRAVGL